MRPGTLKSLQKWLRARSQQSARRHLRHFPGSALCWFFFLFFSVCFSKSNMITKLIVGPFCEPCLCWNYSTSVIWRKLLLSMRVKWVAEVRCQFLAPCSGAVASQLLQNRAVQPGNSWYSCPERRAVTLVKSYISILCFSLFQRFYLLAGPYLTEANSWAYVAVTALKSARWCWASQQGLVKMIIYRI